MASGSFFTIYRKRKDKSVLAKVALDAIKNQYYLSNKRSSFNGNKTDDELKSNVPILMDASFKAELTKRDDLPSYIFYDNDGYEYDKLLDFHFCSTFSCLKEYFRLDAYSFKNSSTLISKDEAKKILQAIDYVLSNEYSKKFEDVLSNEYVELFGAEYSPFVHRFDDASKPIYIDKNDDGFVVRTGDDLYDREIAECDNDAIYNMKKTKACMEAFLRAEDNSWDKQELILEYLAY